MAHLAALALLLANPPEVSPEFQELVKKSMTDYNLGYFDSALKEAEQAYRIDPRPALLFNLGQCHRSLKHWERAEFFYRSYLRNNPSAKNKEVVLDLIEKMQAREKEEPAPAPAPSSTEPVVVVEAPPTPTTPAAPAAAVNATPPVAEATASAPTRTRIWPWVLGAGAVLFAGAAVWGWYEAANYPSVKQGTVGNPESLSQANGQNSLAVAGFGTALAGGAVAIGLATGAVLTW